MAIITFINIVVVALGSLFVISLLIMAIGTKNAYTLEDWEAQQKEDFKKHGPVPDKDQDPCL